MNLYLSNWVRSKYLVVWCWVLIAPRTHIKSQSTSYHVNFNYFSLNIKKENNQNIFFPKSRCTFPPYSKTQGCVRFRTRVNISSWKTRKEYLTEQNMLHDCEFARNLNVDLRSACPVNFAAHNIYRHVFVGVPLRTYIHACFFQQLKPFFPPESRWV